MPRVLVRMLPLRSSLLCQISPRMPQRTQPPLSKRSLPEAPKDIPNPLQNFLGERGPALLNGSCVLADLSYRVCFSFCC